MKRITETEIDFESAGVGDHGLKSVSLQRPKVALKMETELVGTNINLPVPKVAQGKYCRITIEVLP